MVIEERNVVGKKDPSFPEGPWEIEEELKCAAQKMIELGSSVMPGKGLTLECSGRKDGDEYIIYYGLRCSEKDVSFAANIGYAGDTEEAKKAVRAAGGELKVEDKRIYFITSSRLKGNAGESKASASESQGAARFNLPGYDFDYAKSILGSEEVIEEIINTFAKSVPSETAELNSAYENIENEEGRKLYRVKVHALKSSTKMIGNMEFSALCYESEMAAADNNIEVIKENHDKILSGLVKIEKELTEAFNIDLSSAAANDEGSEEELKELLTTLKKCASENDIDRCEEIADLLENVNDSTELGKVASAAYDALMGFDYEQVISVLEDASCLQ